MSPAHKLQVAGAVADTELPEIASIPAAVAMSEKLTVVGQMSLFGGKVAM